MKPKKTDTEPLRLETGAPAELRAIEEDTRNARERRDKCMVEYVRACDDALKKPMEKDGTDWSRIEEVAKRQLDDSEKRLTELRKLLLPYDKNIDESKRDITEKISRDDAAKFAKMFVIHTREATMKLAGQFADKILAQVPREVFDSCAVKTKSAVHDFTFDAFQQCHATGIGSAIRETHLPEFFETAVKSVL